MTHDLDPETPNQSQKPHNRLQKFMDRNLLTLTGVYIHVRACLAFTRVDFDSGQFRRQGTQVRSAYVCLYLCLSQWNPDLNTIIIICCSLCVYCILILFRQNHVSWNPFCGDLCVIDGQIDKYIDNQIDREIDKQTNRQIDRQNDWEIEGQMNRWIHRQMMDG